MAARALWVCRAAPGRDKSGRQNVMSNDRKPPSGQQPSPGDAGSASTERWVPLPSASPGAPAGGTGQRRTEGLRRVRRLSNWTAAALVVGTGATTLALVHNAVPVSAPMATSASSTTGTGTSAVTNGTSGPRVAHSVATTSASGVTTTTTTHVVNGKTVVTHVQHVPAYHDN